MALVFLDVDGVTLDLGTEWLNRYNEDYNDKLTNEHITRWATHEFVKPECGRKIYDYLLMPDLYDNVQPIAGAREGVEILKGAGHRVVFLSSGIHRGKYLRLKQLGFLNREDDYICAHDKSLVSGDYLVDDGVHNIIAFRKTRGIPVLFDAPHNQLSFQELRAMNWTDVTSMIEKVEVRKREIRESIPLRQDYVEPSPRSPMYIAE